MKKTQRSGKRQLNLENIKQIPDKVSPKNKSTITTGRQTAARKSLNNNKANLTPKKIRKSFSSDTQEEESDFQPKGIFGFKKKEKKKLKEIFLYFFNFSYLSRFRKR